tara:strand:- start:54 stop:257 length:204 start_codon:yes stop_codon:yes gene_type:complete
MLKNKKINKKVIMAEYVMALKESKDSNGIVFKTNSTSLEEAKEFFRQLKQMPKEDFSKLFVVSEVKK